MSVAADGRPRAVAARARPAVDRAPARWCARARRGGPGIALTAVSLVYLALSIDRRYAVSADELAAFGAAMRIVAHGPLTHNLVEQLFVNPYAIAALAWLVGVERAFVAGRWLQAIFGLITLLGTFELGRRLTGRAWLGVAAAALLAWSPFFVHTHHNLRMDNPETTGLVLTLVAAAAWIRRPGVPRLLLVTAGCLWMVAGKLLGLIYLPGLLGVLVAWRLRGQGGLALAAGGIAALWLAWVLPQTLVLRAGLAPDQAQGSAVWIALGLVGLIFAAFLRPIGGLFRRARIVLTGVVVATLVLIGIVVSPIGSNSRWTQTALINYQLQRFTLAFDENHPGNQERFPEGYTWYLVQWARGAVGPETVGLAAAGIVALALDRRRRDESRLIQHPGGGLLLLLPLIAGFAFLGGARSWFIRYSLPLLPIVALLAALGGWEIARRLGDWSAGWLARWSARPALVGRRLAVAGLAIGLGGVLLGHLGADLEQNRVGAARGRPFFELRESFGHQVEPGDIVLADHEDSWIWDSRLFFENTAAYPLLMLGLPRESQLVNLRYAGPALADWLVTDRPVGWESYRLTFAADPGPNPWYFDEGVFRYYVYRNRYGVRPNESVSLDVLDLLRDARIEGGNNPGGLVRWNVAGLRRRVVRSHPGDGVSNTIAFSIVPVAGERLRGSYGYNPEAAGQPTDGATVRIRVLAGGLDRTLLDDPAVRPPRSAEYCRPTLADRSNCDPNGNWPAFDLDLAPFAGQSVDVILETGPGPSGSSAFDWTGWGDLRVSADR